MSAPECLCSSGREVPHRLCPVHGRDVRNAATPSAPCPVCGHWIYGQAGNTHDREIHQIAALERIATALEARA